MVNINRQSEDNGGKWTMEKMRSNPHTITLHVQVLQWSHGDMAAQGDMLSRICNTDDSTYTTVDISRIQPPVECSTTVMKATYRWNYRLLGRTGK